MSIERFGVGPRMSMAVAHGQTVYLAGHVASNPKGTSVTEQTRDILAQIEARLVEAGSDKSKILSANIWLTDMSTFAEMTPSGMPGWSRATRRPAPPSRRIWRRRTTRSRSW